MLSSIKLCNFSELPKTGSVGFDPLNQGCDTVFVVNSPQGLVAYKDVCPHYGSTALPWRKNNYLNAAATKIVCAAHGAEFEIETGVCVIGPCLGQSLSAVSLDVTEDGSIFALIEKNEE